MKKTSYLTIFTILAGLLVTSCANQSQTAVYSEFGLIDKDNVVGFALGDTTRKDVVRVPKGFYKIDSSSGDVVLKGINNFVATSDFPRFQANCFVIKDNVQVFESSSKGSKVIASLSYPKMLASRVNAPSSVNNEMTEVVDEKGLHGYVETASLLVIVSNFADEPPVPAVISLQVSLGAIDIMSQQRSIEKGTKVVLIAKSQDLKDTGTYTLLTSQGFVCSIDKLDFEQAKVEGSNIVSNSAAYEITLENKNKFALSRNEIIPTGRLVRIYLSNLSCAKVALFHEIIGPHESALGAIDLESGVMLPELPTPAQNTLFELKGRRGFGFIRQLTEPDDSHELVVAALVDNKWQVFTKESTKISDEFFDPSSKITATSDAESIKLGANGKELNIGFKNGIISL